MIEDVAEGEYGAIGFAMTPIAGEEKRGQEFYENDYQQADDKQPTMTQLISRRTSETVKVDTPGFINQY